MDNSVFDKNISYLDRFMDKQTRRYDFPSFSYIDAKFHPILKDHLIVLSENHIPENLKYA